MSELEREVVGPCGWTRTGVCQAKIGVACKWPACIHRFRVDKPKKKTEVGPKENS